MTVDYDPVRFAQRFERAVRERTSMPCPYEGWDNPENWELFTDDTGKIPDGEVVLAFRSGASGPYAFRKYDAASGLFKRQDGGSLAARDIDELYLYTGAAAHETDIPSPNLEDIL